MKVIYKTEKIDLSQPCWRLSVNYDFYSEIIEIKTENFKWGFLSGEAEDEIFNSQYRSSLFTKRKDGYEYVMSRYYEVLENFYYKLDKIKLESEVEFGRAQKKHNSTLKSIGSLKSLGLFSHLDRDDKIDSLIG